MLLVAPALVLLWLGASCGGGAPPARSTEPEPMPSDANATLDLLDRAENDLSLALGGAPAGASGLAKQEPTAEADEEKRDEQDDKDATTQLGARSTARDSCASACKALLSMQRAVEHLCGLTGEADVRCDTARGRVARAEDRVRSSCPKC
jgi:hypothetical protein